MKGPWKTKLIALFGLLIAIPPIALVLTGISAEIEQQVYLAKVLPVLRSIDSPTDSRLKSLERTDSWGFTTEVTSTKLTDGWVIVLQRAYIADEDPVYLREYFKHRVIIYRDSDHRIYVKDQGFLPGFGVNDKGEDDYSAAEDISANAFFERELRSVSRTNWAFKRIN